MKTLFCKLCLLSLLFIFWVDVKAQGSLPPVYEIKSDAVSEFLIDSTYWQILADPDSDLTFEQVRQPPLSTDFSDIQSLRRTLKKPGDIYWYRYRIKNLFHSTIRICVGSVAPRADFYFVDSSGAYKHYRTGWNYHLKEKDGFKKANVISIEIAPYEEVFAYFRRYQLIKSAPGVTNIKISNAYHLMKSELTEYDRQYYAGEFAIQPFFSGLFILAAIFNIFFFFVVRERVYLYLSLFLFTLSISYNSTIMDVLFPASYLVSRILLRFIFISFFFLLQYVRHYFKTFVILPKWDIALRTMGVLLCIFYLFDVIWGDDLPSVTDARVSLGILLCIVLLITIFRARKKQPAKIGRFFLLAVAPFLLFLAFGLISVIVIILLNKMTGYDFEAVESSITKWGDFIWYCLLAWAAIVFSWALFDRYNAQRKEIAQQAIDREKEINELIKKQKAELEIQVAERTSDLKKSLEELKSTQAQLIQSEKMASLGELTAGIAHEIQNPLNFVNNFSEVNTELIEELKSEKSKVKNERDEKLEGEILIDIEQNLEKILHHGKRADAIVKNMLQHSRTSTGEKELTDINALADEYLRLSYHGMRAKDKSFNAEIKTDFDSSIGKINIIPQDIGRVLLNLFNNAFYAVNEKAKQQSNAYQPIVSVNTKRSPLPRGGAGDEVLLTVRITVTVFPIT